MAERTGQAAAEARRSARVLSMVVCAVLSVWLLPHLAAQAADTTSTQASSAAHDQPTASAAPDELALARAARDAGDAAQAELHYRNAIEHAPTAGAMVELLELLEADPARARDAGRLWKTLLAEFPGDPATLLANGERLLAQDSAAAALAVFARGSEAAPSDARFQERMGDCRAALGNCRAAAQCYEQACGSSMRPAACGSSLRRSRAGATPRRRGACGKTHSARTAATRTSRTSTRCTWPRRVSATRR